MKKGISRTNCNVYNKIDKEYRIFSPDPTIDMTTSYIDAKNLAMSKHKVSEESMNKDIMEILEKAANKKNFAQ